MFIYIKTVDFGTLPPFDLVQIPGSACHNKLCLFLAFYLSGQIYLMKSMFAYQIYYLTNWNKSTE